jgi:hypothetical protein
MPSFEIEDAVPAGGGGFEFEVERLPDPAQPLRLIIARRTSEMVVTFRFRMTFSWT